MSPQRIVDAFARYVDAHDSRITRAMFEQNLVTKKADPVFAADMTPLLAHRQTWSFDAAFDRVWNELVARLP